MAKLPSFKRIIAEDFDAKDRNMISKLSYSINSFADGVISALTNNLSIEDNLNIVKKDISFSLDSSGAIIGALTLQTGLGRLCSGAVVIRVDDLTSSTTYPSSIPFISFTEPSTGMIKINNITNLTAGHKYTVKVLLF